METTKLEDITLSVPDVSCEHCVRAIYGALGEQPGVEAVDTDLANKTVHLRFDPARLPITRVEELLDDAGYPVAK
ncbi:MAG TPA: heavy-metal-associated domain-containing protein [Ktedonobacterales bacterium]|jgi:copper chaperone|nr:heavy-metal-associated domain-containing protein [Ktedonobacterales bacterium]